MSMESSGSPSQPHARSRPGTRPFVRGARNDAPSPASMLAHPVAPPFTGPRSSTPSRDDGLEIVRKQLDEEFAHFASGPVESAAADVLEGVARRIRKGEIVVHASSGWSEAATLAAVLAALLGEAPQAL